MSAHDQQLWKRQMVQYMAKGEVFRARHIQFEHIPDQLFKYISVQDFEKKTKAFVTDRVWVRDPAQMNDPYDSALTFNGIALGNHAIKKQFPHFAETTEMTKYLSTEEIEQVRKEDDPIEGLKKVFLNNNKYKNLDVKGIFAFAENHIKPRCEQLKQELSNRLRSSLKMACFSEVSNAILMWTHYASEHQGFCIEYNFNQLTDARKNLVYPVIYVDSLPDVTQIMMDQESQMLLSTIAALHKSIAWQEEREWRLIIPGGIIQEDSLFPVNAPKAVYLGARIQPNHRKEILEIAEWKNIPAFEIYAESNSFTLSTRKIE